MDFESKLIEEIEDEFKHLKAMDVGTDEYKVTVDGLTKLVDRAIEIEKVKNAKEEKAKSQKFEEELKTKQDEFDQKIRKTELDSKLQQAQTDYGLKSRQANDEAKNRLIGNCIAAAGIVIPAMITIWGTLKSLEFEKEGTVTTIVGRGFINKLLPKK